MLSHPPWLVIKCDCVPIKMCLGVRGKVLLLWILQTETTLVDFFKVLQPRNISKEPCSKPGTIVQLKSMAWHSSKMFNLGVTRHSILGSDCDYSVTPSPNWTRIFYFFGFGIGSRGTGFGTRA